MLTARNYFENQLQVLDITKKAAAKILNVSAQTVSYYLSETKELKFLTAINSVDSIFEGDDSFLKLYCVESEKPENIKASLEYLSTNRHLKELGQLIYKCDSFNILNDWADTYKIILKFQEGEALEGILQDIYGIFPSLKDAQLKALLKVLEANVHHKLYESTSFTRLIASAEASMSEMKDGYFKDSLAVRIIELKSQEALFVNNDEKLAREYADKIISSKIGKKFVADSYNIIGMSYLYDNKDKALKYINKSIKLLRKVGHDRAADNYENGTKRFVLTYWGEELANADENTQESEIAFMMAKRGEGKKSAELLEGMEKTAFRLYYKGVALDDPMLHFQALSEFISRGEKFYAQLPYRELIKHEAYKEVAKNLLK